MSVIVLFREDFRSDDAESVLAVIRSLPGVVSVEPRVNSGFDAAVAQTKLAMGVVQRVTDHLDAEIDALVETDDAGRVLKRYPTP